VAAAAATGIYASTAFSYTCLAPCPLHFGMGVEPACVSSCLFG
jgi:hypothetical protein